jgi:Ca2+-binding RTX toxin-like protein
MDSNWNWVSSEGQWAVNSTDAFNKETVFGVDANGDGFVGSPYTAIESVGNTKFVKDATNKYFAQIGTTPAIAIKYSGTQISKDFFGTAWQTLAVETVNGGNQVLWKNVAGNFLHIWKTDSNWNWVSSEGQWAVNSVEAFNKETIFGVDANGDGFVGNSVSLNLIGTSANDTLIGGAKNDVLKGLGGKDLLTGGLGSDRFDYKILTDSLLANFDVIIDFNANANNDLFLVTTARSGFTNAGAVATLDNTGIIAKLNTTNFGINAAAQFTFGNRSFVAINDGTAGFSQTNDAIIEITGLTRTLGLTNFVTV